VLGRLDDWFRTAAQRGEPPTKIDTRLSPDFGEGHAKLVGHRDAEPRRGAGLAQR